MLLNRFTKVFLEENDGDGNDLGGANPVETQDSDAQKIIDKINGKENPDDVKLPSDENNNGEKLFADKYKTVDDLKKGIGELGSTLPDYVINGMSEDALEQHYVELRKEFSSKSKKEDGKNRKYTDKKDEEDGSDENENADEVKEKDPQLWNQLETQFNESGSITDDMYDKLEEMGIPSNVVDKYLDGLNAERVAFTNKVYEIAGGEAEYNQIKAWAEDGNISDAELKAIQNMSYDAILGAYQGIKARYDLATGKSGKPVRIVGDTNVSKVGSYASREEYMADISDKKYGVNRAYTQAVETKFRNSNFK